jgi:hypothetical protein
MKLLIISLTILIINFNCYGQTKKIVGEVRNSKSNLAYVNIGIANKTVGTVSNAEGFFNLVLNDAVKPNDTVTFSYIGFKTEKYLVSELNKENNIILLSPEQMELNEAIVSSNKIKLKVEKTGKDSKELGSPNSNFYSYSGENVDDRLSKENGMKLKINSNCHVKDLNFDITTNDFASLKFRVNFYKIVNDLPTDLIVQKDIIFEIKDSYLGRFKVDLEPYKIYFKKDIGEVAVSIQWLESIKKDEKSKFFSISTVAASPVNTAYFRAKAMDTWKKSRQSLSFYLETEFLD